MDSHIQFAKMLFMYQLDIRYCVCIFSPRDICKTKKYQISSVVIISVRIHLQDIGNHSGEKSTAVENRLKFKILNKRQKQRQMTNDKWRKISSANQ